MRPKSRCSLVGRRRELISPIGLAFEFRRLSRRVRRQGRLLSLRATATRVWILTVQDVAGDQFFVVGQQNGRFVLTAHLVTLIPRQASFFFLVRQSDGCMYLFNFFRNFQAAVPLRIHVVGNLPPKVGLVGEAKPAHCLRQGGDV